MPCAYALLFHNMVKSPPWQDLSWKERLKISSKVYLSLVWKHTEGSWPAVWSAKKAGLPLEASPAFSKKFSLTSFWCFDEKRPDQKRDAVTDMNWKQSLLKDAEVHSFSWQTRKILVIILFLSLNKFLNLKIYS